MAPEIRQYLNHNLSLFPYMPTGTALRWGARIDAGSETKWLLSHEYAASDIQLAQLRNQYNLPEGNYAPITDAIWKHLRGRLLIGDFSPRTETRFDIRVGSTIMFERADNDRQPVPSDQVEIEVLILRALRRVRNELCRVEFKVSNVDLSDVCAYLPIDERDMMNALIALGDRGQIRVRPVTGSLWTQFHMPYITEDGLAALQSREDDLAAPRFAQARRRPAVKVFGLLERYFNEQDFQILALKLELNYDQIPGETYVQKAIQVVDMADRSKQLRDLIDVILEMRPKLEAECKEIIDGLNGASS